MTNIPKYEIYYSSLDGCLDGKRSDGRPVHQSLLSEGTPLLPKATPPAHHLPISLRMVHSPWRFIRQKPLAAIRTIITLYMTFILAISLYFEIRYVKHAKLYAFKAGHLSLLVQVIFYWISTVGPHLTSSNQEGPHFLIKLQIWTFHHIFKPVRIHLGEDVLPTGFWQRVGAFFEPPTSTEPNSKKMLAFSVFYTAASTFPFLVTIIYWLCLFHPEPAEIGHIALRYFILVNVYGVTAIIAFLEIVLLNSARKQKVRQSSNHRGCFGILTDTFSRMLNTSKASSLLSLSTSFGL